MISEHLHGSKNDFLRAFFTGKFLRSFFIFAASVVVSPQVVGYFDQTVRFEFTKRTCFQFTVHTSSHNHFFSITSKGFEMIFPLFQAFCLLRISSHFLAFVCHFHLSVFVHKHTRSIIFQANYCTEFLFSLIENPRN